MTRLLHPDVRTMPLDDLPLEPDAVVTGSPAASLTPLAELGGREIGVWEISPGTVTDVEDDEVFVVLSGSAHVMFESDGSVLEIGPGSAVRLHAGERTTWVVHETLRKVYVA